MLLTLFILAGLGLAAVDPIGLAAMPLLLTSPRPYRRSVWFLGGSFAALVVLGMVCALGLGAVLARFETDHAPVIKLATLAIGLVLLGYGMYALVRRPTHTLSARAKRWLSLDGWHLFGFGAVLVSLQSAADLVFVLAMARLGQAQLPFFAVLVCVVAYAVAALALQLALVVVATVLPHQVQALGRRIDRQAGLIVALASITLGVILCTVTLR